jgi:hypothetical protein
MVWNPFSGISGLLSSPTEEEGKQIDPRYGIPRADVYQAQMGLLGNIGATLLAAGQRISPADRARLLAQVGPQTAQFSTDIYNAAQRRYQQGLLDEAKAKRLEEAKQQAQTQEERARLGAMMEDTYEKDAGGNWVKTQSAYGPEALMAQAAKVYPDIAARLLEKKLFPQKTPAELKAEEVARQQEALRVYRAQKEPSYEGAEYQNGVPTEWVRRAPVASRSERVGGLLTAGFTPTEIEALEPSPKIAEPKFNILPDGTTVWTNPETGRQEITQPGGSLTDEQKFRLGMAPAWGGPAGAPLSPSQGQPASTQTPDQATPYNRRIVTDAQVMAAVKPFVGAIPATLSGFEGTIGQAANLFGRPGELNPEINAGARYLNSVANATRRALSGPGRDNVQELKWAQDVLNLPDSLAKRVFSNPASVGNSIIAAARYAEDGIARIDARLKNQGLPPSINTELQREKIDLQDLLAAINSIPGASRVGAPNIEDVMGKALNPAGENP